MQQKKKQEEDLENLRKEVTALQIMKTLVFFLSSLNFLFLWHSINFFILSNRLVQSQGNTFWSQQMDWNIVN